MAQTDLAIRIATVLDAAGLTGAEKGIKSLDKGVKNLGRTLGVSLSAAAVVAFGKAAASAFIQDQKEATQLATAVKNLGLEFSNPAIASYIDNLSRASAVTDGQLRPAFQALLTTTGSLTKSQELLSQAIDISAGSGVELGQVAQDLASAYVGKTKALGKYNLGLTQAELKTAKFTDLQIKLNEQYKGANAAYLTTYAGKMQALSTAAGEASEKIGGALIDSVMLLSGSSGIDDLITKIDKLADKTVGWIDRFSEGIALINAIKNSNIGNMSENIQKVQVEAYNARLRRNSGKAWEGVNIPKTKAQIAAEDAAQRAADKRARDIANATKKNTAELKKQNALKKAGTLFDIDKIQIVAALKGKLDVEEKKRLQLQLALATENTDLVAQLTKEIATSQGLGKELAAFLADLPEAKNPFEAWKSFLDEIEAQARRIALMGSLSSLYGTPVQNFTPYITTPFPDTTSPSFVGPTVPNVTVNVAGSVTTSQSLIDEIRGGLNVAALSGSSANVERRIGGW